MMKIIDAQVHIWSSGTPIVPHRPVSSFSAETLLEEMAAAGVDGAVIHPPSWDPPSNALAVEAVQRHKGKFSILGNFPLDDPASRARVDTWREQSGMVGLRFALLQPHQRA